MPPIDKGTKITLGINTVATLMTAVAMPLIGWLVISEIKGIKDDAHAELMAQQIAADAKYESQVSHDKDIDNIHIWNQRLSSNMSTLSDSVHENHEETQLAIQKLTDAVQKNNN